MFKFLILSNIWLLCLSYFSLWNRWIMIWILLFLNNWVFQVSWVQDWTKFIPSRWNLRFYIPLCRNTCIIIRLSSHSACHEIISKSQSVWIVLRNSVFNIFLHFYINWFFLWFNDTWLIVNDKWLQFVCIFNQIRFFILRLLLF